MTFSVFIVKIAKIDLLFSRKPPDIIQKYSSLNSIKSIIHSKVGIIMLFIMKRGSIHKKVLSNWRKQEINGKLIKIQSNHLYFAIFWANTLHFKH